LRIVLERAAGRVKATLSAEGTDEERIRRFVSDMRSDISRVLGDQDATSSETAAPFEQLWQGLARYWRKKA
jgi:hypothetical protein